MRKEQQAQIVALAYGAQWPLAAIAAQMGLSYMTVLRVVVRAARIFPPARRDGRHETPVSASGALRAPGAVGKGGAP